MDPTEELFHLGSDPLEMNNLATKSAAKDLLETVRKKYGSELEEWKIGSINHPSYHKYIELFERQIPLKDKKLKGEKLNVKNL